MYWIKRGVLIGIALGLLFGIYSNLTECHTSPGGPNGCDNAFEHGLAVLEYGLWILPAIGLARIGLLSESLLGFRILLIAAPVVTFGFLGALIGLIVDKFQE